jgi:hypothetical protein
MSLSIFVFELFEKQSRALLFENEIAHSLVGDKIDTVYILEIGNNRVTRWFKNTKTERIIIGDSDPSSAPASIDNSSYSTGKLDLIIVYFYRPSCASN